MKFITDNKAAGFRLTLIGIVLALLTLVEYTCVYASTRYMSWEAFWILAAGIALCVILIAESVRLTCCPPAPEAR